MTSVSVLFYGRRTRFGRSTSDSDDLGLLSSASDRSHDCNPSHRHRTTSSRKAATSATCTRHHLHPRSDQHHRPNRHVKPGEFDESGRSSFPRHPCSEATVPLDNGPIQRFEGVIEVPFQNIVHRDTQDSIRVRFNSNERLPRSVLLARERLLQRLRGVSAPSPRESHESQPGSHFNYWLEDSPLPSQINEAVSEPQALDRETLATLHHEVFSEVADIDFSRKFSVSDECSICLERFAEGNELIGLPCGHRFHSSCLCPWVQTCRKCPNCRSEISSD